MRPPSCTPGRASLGAPTPRMRCATRPTRRLAGQRGHGATRGRCRRSGGTSVRSAAEQAPSRALGERPPGADACIRGPAACRARPRRGGEHRAAEQRDRDRERQRGEPPPSREADGPHRPVLQESGWNTCSYAAATRPSRRRGRSARVRCRCRCRGSRIDRTVAACDAKYAFRWARKAPSDAPRRPWSRPDHPQIESLAPYRATIASALQIRRRVDEVADEHDVPALDDPSQRRSPRE